MEAIAVFVDDRSDCVDEGLLALALEGVLARSAAVSVSVDSTADDRAVDVRVGRGGRVAWTKHFDLKAADCPSSAEAIAQSIRAGLAPLPGWLVDGDSRSGWTVEVPFSASIGADAQTDARFGAGARLAFGMGPGAVLTGVAAEYGTETPVSIGTAQVAELVAEVGWDQRLNHGPWSLVGGVRGGPVVSWGSGFIADYWELSPTVGLFLGCGFTPAPNLRIAGAVRANLVRVEPTAGQTDVRVPRSVPEPWVRLDLSVSPRFARKGGGE